MNTHRISWIHLQNFICKTKHLSYLALWYAWSVFVTEKKGLLNKIAEWHLNTMMFCDKIYRVLLRACYIRSVSFAVDLFLLLCIDLSVRPTEWRQKTLMTLILLCILPFKYIAYDQSKSRDWFQSFPF